MKEKIVATLGVLGVTACLLLLAPRYADPQRGDPYGARALQSLEQALTATGLLAYPNYAAAPVTCAAGSYGVYYYNTTSNTAFVCTSGGWMTSASATSSVFAKGATVLSPTAVNVITWYAPYACTVTNVRGYRVGGTGATINARLNGTDNHLAAALSVTSADTWMDGGAVQNTAYAAGDKMEIMVVTVAGDPTQIEVQVDFTRP